MNILAQNMLKLEEVFHQTQDIAICYFYFYSNSRSFREMPIMRSLTFENI